jgi:hypothetical protein
MSFLISLCLRFLEWRYAERRRGHLSDLCEAFDLNTVFAAGCQHRNVPIFPNMCGYVAVQWQPYCAYATRWKKCSVCHF